MQDKLTRDPPTLKRQKLASPRRTHARYPWLACIVYHQASLLSAQRNMIDLHI